MSTAAEPVAQPAATAAAPGAEKAPLEGTPHAQTAQPAAPTTANGAAANGHANALPATENEKGTAPLNTSAPTAHQASTDTTTSPTSPTSAAGTGAAGANKNPKQIKADLKNESAYAKVLEQKSKAEGQELKAAIKDGQSATKTDAKAAKGELKAKKALDKAIKNEYKLNKKLVDIKAKYDAAVVALEQAKAKMELKQSHHETTTALRDEKLGQIDTLKRRSMAPGPEASTATA